MPIVGFPDPRRAGPEGIVALGGDLHPDSLVLAYSSGIFPWPIDEFEPLPWFCPEPRAILEFKDLHVPKSLEKIKKRTPWEISIDRAFKKVISACAQVKRPGQRGTWIRPDMARAYLKLHQMGIAHSVEVWDGPNLIGGLYGVEVKGIFSGESMFYLKPNASKLALLHLVDFLKSKGETWIDIQQLTPHLKALGAKEISRDDFLEKLSRTQALGLTPFAQEPKS